MALSEKMNSFIDSLTHSTIGFYVNNSESDNDPFVCLATEEIGEWFPDDIRSEKIEIINKLIIKSGLSRSEFLQQLISEIEDMYNESPEVYIEENYPTAESLSSAYFKVLGFNIEINLAKIL